MWQIRVDCRLIRPPSTENVSRLKLFVVHVIVELYTAKNGFECAIGETVTNKTGEGEPMALASRLTLVASTDQIADF